MKPIRGENQNLAGNESLTTQQGKYGYQDEQFAQNGGKSEGDLGNDAALLQHPKERTGGEYFTDDGHQQASMRFGQEEHFSTPLKGQNFSIEGSQEKNHDDSNIKTPQPDSGRHWPKSAMGHGGFQPSEAWQDSISGRPGSQAGDLEDPYLGSQEHQVSAYGAQARPSMTNRGSRPEGSFSSASMLSKGQYFQSPEAEREAGLAGGKAKADQAQGRPASWAVKEKPAYLQTLTTLRKARILNAALHHIMSSHKLKAFHVILGAKIKQLRGWGEAGTRVKGRLLYMLKTRYADVGVRRSFLKWALISKPNFLRNCVMKLALTARLDEHTVFWRFRKVIEKRLNSRIPDSAKSARFVLGSFLLHFLFKRIIKVRKIETMNWIRPKIIGKNCKILAKFMANRISKFSLMQKRCFSHLRYYAHQKHSRLLALISSLNSKTTAVYDLLKMNWLAIKLGLSEAEAVHDLELMNRALKGAVSRRVNDVMRREHLEQREGRLQSVIGLLAKAAQGKASTALAAVSKAKERAVGHETKLRRAKAVLLRALQDKTQHRVKEAWLNLRAGASTAQMQTSIEALKASQQTATSARSARATKHRLQLCTAAKTRQAFECLAANCWKISLGEYKLLAMKTRQGNLRLRLISKLGMAFRLKQNAAFSRLAEHSKSVRNSASYKNKMLSRLFFMFSHSSRAKLGGVLNHLRARNSDEAAKIEKQQDFERKQTTLRAAFFGKIGSGSKQKAAIALKFLSNFRKHQKEKELKLTSKLNFITLKLANASRAKERAAVDLLKRFLLSNIVESSALLLANQRKNLVKFKAVARLASSGTHKTRQAFAWLLGYAGTTRLQEDRELRSMKRSMGKLAKAQTEKLCNSFQALLGKGRELAVVEDTVKAQVQAKQARIGRLLRLLLRACSEKTENCMHQLDSFKRADVERKTAALRQQKWLFSMLEAACQTKVRIVFNALGNNRLEAIEADQRATNLQVRKAGLVKNLANRIVGAYAKKSSHALALLKMHQTQAALRIHRLSRATNTFVLRMAQFSTRDLFKAYLRLKQHSAAQQSTTKVAGLLVSGLVNKLGTSLGRKQANAFRRLQTFMTKAVDLQAHKSKKLGTEFHRLAAAHHTKLRIAMNALLQHSSAAEAARSLATIQAKRADYLVYKLLYRLVKNSDQKIGQTFQRLAIHNVSKSQQEDKLATKAKLFFGRLAASCSGKIAKAVEILQDNLYTKAADDSRRTVGLMFFSNKMHLKLRDAFGKLQQHRAVQMTLSDLRRLAKKTFIDQFKNKLTSSCQDSLRRSLQHLKRFVLTEKKHEALKANLLAKLGCSLRQKLRESFVNLKSHHIYLIGESKLSVTLMENLVERELHLKKRLFKRLVGSMRLSCAGVIRLLKYLNAEYKENQMQALQAVRAVTGRLEANDLRNKRFILNKMKAHSKIHREYRDYIFKICSRIAGNLTTARTGLLYQAYFTLLRHKLEAEQQAALKKSHLATLFGGLITSQTGKTHQAFEKTLRFNSGMQSQQRQEAFGRNKIVASLVRGGLGKMNQAFRSLRKAGFDQTRAATAKNLACSRIFRSIKAANHIKLSDALGRLIHFRSLEDRSSLKKQLSSKLLVRFLVGNYKNLAKKALEILKANRATMYHQDQTRRKTAGALAVKLGSALEGKVRRVFSTLVSEFEEDQRRQHLDYFTKRRTIERLISNFTGMASKGYFKMKELSLLRSGIQGRKSTALSHLLNRLATTCDSKKRCAIDQLQIVSIDMKTKENLKRRVIQRLTRSLEGQARQALAKLQVNQALEKLHLEAKRIKLGAVVARAQQSLIRQAYRSMEKHCKNCSRFAAIMEKYNHRLKSQAAASAFNRWSLQSSLDKKKTKAHKILVLFDALRDRLKTATKLAFTKWRVHSSEPKNKCQTLDSMLRRMVRIRVSHALHKLMNKSEIAGADRRKQAVRGLLKSVITLFDKKKNGIFAEFKQMYHSDNKWFKKVIFLWTQQSKLHPQKAFWRIKDQKILGISSVETSKAVRLKSFMSMFHKKELKTLASVFSAIHYSAVFKSWQFSQLASPTKSLPSVGRDGSAIKDQQAEEDADPIDNLGIQLNFAKSEYIPQSKNL
jgi:hypothetical protein